MMKAVFLLMIALLPALVAPAQNTKTTYTCPMHPEIQQSGPGKCPKCGMTLEKKTIRVKAPSKKPTAPPKTVPPKKPVENKPEEVVPVQDSVEHKNEAEYTCPMHPEVRSDKPGRCSKCGMALVKTGEDHTEHQGTRNVDTSHAGEIEQDRRMGTSVVLHPGKTVVYHLFVRDTMVNFTGRQKHAIAINGTIPGPPLVFTEGDTAEIHLHNELKEETSLHWHGIILPNRFDGVPYLTTKRVGPGETYVYKFKIAQNGTYWYHSHSALQEQVGMYGALVLKKREQGDTTVTTPVATPDEHAHHAMGAGEVTSLHEYNVVLSEWTDDHPMQVQRRLRTANDWFSIKKGSTQSYAEAIREGHFWTKFVNEWKRMKAMDVSDVFYEKFLINGQTISQAPAFKEGDRVRLRVVNAGASSYFWLTWAGGKITVVGNDGNDVEPVEVDRLIVSVAETYDVEVTIPPEGSYEFRATAEDRTGYASLFLGTGEKKAAAALPRLKYFEGMKMMNDMMNTDGTMKDMGMNMSLQKMDMNVVMYPEITGGQGDPGPGNNPDPGDMSADSSMGGMDHSMHTSSQGGIVTLNYDMLRSPFNSALPDERTRVLHFTLTGNMNRYVWTLDNKTVKESDRIFIEQGEKLRVVLTNNSMMRHPMHLHGHDFRVVNSFGEYSPLKNVLDIMPMETDTIEFAANQEGNWFFHCHILYHMMAGMGRVFAYHKAAFNPDLPDREEAYRQFRRHPDQNMKHLMARIGLESNGSDGEAMLTSTRYALSTEWRIGLKKHHGIESETIFGRYLGANQWWFPYVGFDYHYNSVENETEKNFFGQQSNQNNRRTFTIGVQYTMPWLLLADARLDGKGKFRFQLSREDIPLTARLRLAFMGNTDREYMVGLAYIATKWLALSTHYDSDMGMGAGITIIY